MFLDFFYLLRARGLQVSMNEWMTLQEALNKGLAYASLLEFYYLSRAILVKTEADFDKFDLVFAEYFHDVQTFEDIPKEVFDWLSKPKSQKEYDKEEVDRRTSFGFDELREMLEERLKQQDSRHDGGPFWIGTGGTSVLGHSGYAATGIRVGGESQHRRALQVAGERTFQDFREDNTLDLRQFQMAFRRLRQYSARQDGPKDELDLDETIQETCNNAGNLKLVYDRPRVNTVKVLMLFDSGGSMWPYAELCSQLFQAVSKSSHFKDLKIYYFHNAFYEKLYTTPGCYPNKTIDTQWVMNNLSSEYKVIIVGDAAMAPSELLHIGGSSLYNYYNKEPGIDWLRRLAMRYQKTIWFNPIPADEWEHGYGWRTIQVVRREVPMYHLAISGLETGLKYLVAAR